MSECPNSLDKEHRPVQNNQRSHYICERCSKVLSVIPKEEKRPNS